MLYFIVFVPMLFSLFILQAGRIASLTGSVLNLVVIMLLSKVYTRLAKVLTQWGERASNEVSSVFVMIIQSSWFIILPSTEMHRTQTKYEDAFILKVFIFQFVNFYSSPMYIAFFKGRWVYSKHCLLFVTINRCIKYAVLFKRFVGYPGNYNTLFGIRNEDVSLNCIYVDTMTPWFMNTIGITQNNFELLSQWSYCFILFHPVWCFGMSYWTCPRAVGHHGRQTSHQQCSRICSPVSPHFSTRKNLRFQNFSFKCFKMGLHSWPPQ